MTVTLANLTPDRDFDIKLEGLGFSMGRAAEIGWLGDGDLHAHNTFDAPETVSVRRELTERFDGTLTLRRGSVAAVRFAMQ